MITSLKAEVLKLRRKHILLISLGMILVELFWLSFAMFFNDSDFARNGYQTMLYQLPVLNSLFFPVIIGVMVSRFCDMEHKGSNYKSLFVIQRKAHIFSAKYIISIVFLMLFVFIEVLFVALLGKFSSFHDTFSVVDYTSFFFSQTVTSILVSTIFLVLSLCIKNQFIPFIVGIITGFLGFLSAFFPPIITKIIPSSYYMLLSTVSMNWDIETRIVDYYYVPFKWEYFIAISALSIFSYLVSVTYFKRKEV